MVFFAVLEGGDVAGIVCSILVNGHCAFDGAGFNGSVCNGEEAFGGSAGDLDFAEIEVGGEGSWVGFAKVEVMGEGAKMLR